MQIIKKLFLALAALAAVLSIALVFVVLNIDLNNYKPQIQAAVERETGRKFHIEGSIGLSLFPTLSLDLKQVALDNPPGFEDRFLSVERVRTRLNLLPLLQKRLEVGKIALEKPKIILHTLRDGRTNWEDLTDQKPGRQPQDQETFFTSFHLAGVEIENAGVTWRDEQSREHLQADAVTFKVGALVPGSPIAIEFGGAVSDKRRGLSANFSLDTKVSLDLGSRRVEMDRLDLVVRLQQGDAAPVDIAARTSVVVDPAADWAELRGLSVSAAGSRISGAAKIVGLSDKAKVKFTLTGDKLAPRKFATALNVSAPHFPKQAQLDVAATVDLGKDAGTFERLVVTVEDARVEGSGSFSGLLSGRPGFDAAIKTSEFDLRALAGALDVSLPDTADDQAFSRFAASGRFGLKTGKDSVDVVIRQSNISLDDSRVSMQGDVTWAPSLRVKLDGELDRVDAGRYLPANTAGSIQVLGLRAQVRVENGKASVSVPTAQVFGGRFGGTFFYDEVAGAPLLRSRGRASDIKVEQALAASGADQLLKGAGSLSYELSAAGNNEQEWLRSLVGTVKLELENGAFAATKLAHSVDRVIAFFEKRPARVAGKELIFDKAAASFSIKHGVADNRDLNVDMPLLHLHGAGRVGFARSNIDYRLQVGLLRQQPDERIYVPIRITGTFDDLKYSVDLGQVIQHQAKHRVKREVGKVKEKARESIKDKLGDIFKDNLLKKLPF